MSTAVILRFSGPGYFDWLGQKRIYENWLSSREIEYEFVYLDTYNTMPTAAMIKNPQDATAFKLRFGL